MVSCEASGSRKRQAEDIRGHWWRPDDERHLLPAVFCGAGAEHSSSEAVGVGCGQVQSPGYCRGRSRWRRRDHPRATVAALARRYSQEAAGQLQATEEEAGEGSQGAVAAGGRYHVAGPIRCLTSSCTCGGSRARCAAMCRDVPRPVFRCREAFEKQRTEWDALCNEDLSESLRLPVYLLSRRRRKGREGRSRGAAGLPCVTTWRERSVRWKEQARLKSELRQLKQEHPEASSASSAFDCFFWVDVGDSELKAWGETLNTFLAERLGTIQKSCPVLPSAMSVHLCARAFHIQFSGFSQEMGRCFVEVRASSLRWLVLAFLPILQPTKVAVRSGTLPGSQSTFSGNAKKRLRKP